MPKCVIVGFVSNAAFNGDITKNPYLQLSTSRIEFPLSVIRRISNSIKTITTGFLWIREDYPRGYFLTAFDVSGTRGKCGALEFAEKRKSKNGGQIRFSLKETINCIV
ncbi:hypothetical protein J437_LFUL006959 [Ladona fulva]|uniref:Uncharacterized protein n=1 Tax=Ladona fulva TaxID=123851 RepID=A0A8K0P3T4_LADFU|nr:hypothetical protein J437_LFUL006959 [Ladona fulva]